MSNTFKYLDGGGLTYLWEKIRDNFASSGHTHTFSSLTSKPTTLSGYGITDGVTTNTLNSSLSKYLKLSGGNMTGILYANRAIIAQGSGSNKGYQGYFNNSNYELIGTGAHIFNSSGKAQGYNALSFGQNSFAGIINQDSDKDEYPYLALQPMNTQPIEVKTTTSSLGVGKFYGYPLLAGEVVEYSTPDGGKFTYENTSNRTQILLLVKNSDDRKLIFAGTPDHANLRDICYILFSNGFPSYLSEVITQVTERTIGDTTYYEVILRTFQTSSFPARYDFKTQNQFNCITKVNDTILSSASAYRSGGNTMAFNYGSYALGGYSITLGMNSWATNFTSLALGYNSKAVSTYSIAMGAGSLASGDNAKALGLNSVASGAYSTTIGTGSLASGQNSITLGVMSQARGSDSIAFGYESIAEATNAIAFGANSHAKNSYSTVFAFHGTSFQDNQTVFGKYNAEETGALLVGGGTSDTNRKNIFKVDWSGNVTGKFFSGYSNSVGGEGFKIYPENTNEINFGGIGSCPEIIFGKSSKDNRSIPTVYKFGANGDATIQAASFSGNANTATKLSAPQSLWGNSFDGLTGVDGSLVFMPADTVQNLNGLGMKINPDMGFIGFSNTINVSGNGTDIFTGISLGWGTNPETKTNSVRINDSTFTYKGNDIYHTGNLGVVTASTNGLMSSEMYNTKKVSSISIRQGAAAFEEIPSNHDIYVTYNEDNAENSGTHMVGGDESIKIPNATTDYDGSMSYIDKRKLDSFNVDTSTNYYMGNVIRIDASYLLPPDSSLADIKGNAPLYGIIADHLELMNGISNNKIPEMIRLTIHNFTYMFSLNTADYTNNQFVYVCPHVQVQLVINSGNGQFTIESFNPI